MSSNQDRSRERVDFLASVLVTAIEGGINYWANVRKYKVASVDGNLTYAYAEVRDIGERDYSPVTLDTIALGIARIRNGEPSIAPGFLDEVREADEENDASNMDSEAADIILQVGLFNELVYA